MKSKLIIILSLFLASIMFYSCCSCKTQQNSNISIEEAKRLNIELTKSECFGKCPAFTLNYKNGEIFLNAISNMERLGIFKIKLTNDEIIDLYNTTLESKVLENLEEESYMQNATDLPFSKITIFLEEKLKIINYRVKGPKTIVSLDEKIMKIIKDVKRYEERED